MGSTAKKRARFNAYADHTRDPDKPLVQPKINRGLLDIGIHNLWVHWSTKTMRGKYNAEEPSGLPGQALARFTRWWTTERGWNESEIQYDQTARRVRVATSAMAPNTKKWPQVLQKVRENAVSKIHFLSLERIQPLIYKSDHHTSQTIIPYLIQASYAVCTLVRLRKKATEADPKACFDDGDVKGY